MTTVLDASALLGWLQGETGADQVDEALGQGAVIHVVNWAEVLSRLAGRLNRSGLRNSGEVDRHFFRSLDFREPSGVLFEIDADEDRAMPGEKTILPPRFEGRRAQILAGLKPIASVTPSCPWRKR